MSDERKTDLTGDLGLDAFFSAARDDTPVPSGDFMARIEADALSALPAKSQPAPVGIPLWRQVLLAIGGVPGAAGLAAACATGIWIGVAPPQSLSEIWSQSAGLESYEIDPLSGFDLAMLEG